MSFPSLNASSRGLPPIARPSGKSKKLIASFHSRRRSSAEDLPMQSAPLSSHDPFSPPIRPRGPVISHSSPSLAEFGGAEITSTPQAALDEWRTSTMSASPSRPPRASSRTPVAHLSLGISSHRRVPRSVFSSSIDGSDSETSQSSRSDSDPSFPVSALAPHSFYAPAAVHRSREAQSNPLSSAAILLSQKSVRLPHQPFQSPGSPSSAPPTLVQLNIAGSTFIIPADLIEEHRGSHLAHFVGACLDLPLDSPTSDGSFSSVETDDEDAAADDFGVNRSRYSTDSDDLIPPIFIPSANLRAESLDKLQKLGILPPSPPARMSTASDFSIASLTPRADHFPASISSQPITPPPPPPPKSSYSRSLLPSRRAPAPPPSSAGTTTRFLTVLLLRAPEPYVAITHFFLTGQLLSSLRLLLEGEEACKGCPVCGEADRARKLRDVEAEAAWLGLDALVKLCRKERRRADHKGEGSRQGSKSTWI